MEEVRAAIKLGGGCEAASSIARDGSRCAETDAGYLCGLRMSVSRRPTSGAAEVASLT
jgi:hypothetical protein